MDTTSLVIYLASAVAAYFAARKLGVRWWIALFVAWAGVIGLLGIGVALVVRWSREPSRGGSP